MNLAADTVHDSLAAAYESDAEGAAQDGVRLFQRTTELRVLRLPDQFRIDRLVGLQYELGGQCCPRVRAFDWHRSNTNVAVCAGHPPGKLVKQRLCWPKIDSDGACCSLPVAGGLLRHIVEVVLPPWGRWWRDFAFECAPGSDDGAVDAWPAAWCARIVGSLLWRWWRNRPGWWRFWRQWQPHTATDSLQQFFPGSRDRGECGLGIRTRFVWMQADGELRELLLEHRNVGLGGKIRSGVVREQLESIARFLRVRAEIGHGCSGVGVALYNRSLSSSIPAASMIALPVQPVRFADLRLTDRPRYTPDQFHSLVARFATARRDGEHWPVEMPPLLVVRERGGSLTLLDGHHRTMAAQQDGWKSGPARIMSRAAFERHRQRLGLDVKDAIRALAVGGGPDYRRLYERLHRGQPRVVPLLPDVVATPAEDEQLREITDDMAEPEFGLRFTPRSALLVLLWLREHCLPRSSTDPTYESAAQRFREFVEAAVSPPHAPLWLLASGLVLETTHLENRAGDVVFDWGAALVRPDSPNELYHAVRIWGHRGILPPQAIADTYRSLAAAKLDAANFVYARRNWTRVQPPAILDDYATRVVRHALRLCSRANPGSTGKRVMMARFGRFLLRTFRTREGALVAYEDGQ